MGLYERIRDKGIPEPPEATVALPSTTPAQDDPDVIRRTKIAMGYFTRAIQEAKGSRVGTFMRMLTEEMLEESAMVPPEFLEFYMKQAAAILYWTATGENIVNMPMPSDFTNTIPRELRPSETKELPIGESNDLQSDNASNLYNRICLWLPR